MIVLKYMTKMEKMLNRLLNKPLRFINSLCKKLKNLIEMSVYKKYSEVKCLINILATTSQMMWNFKHLDQQSNCQHKALMTINLKELNNWYWVVINALYRPYLWKPKLIYTWAKGLEKWLGMKTLTKSHVIMVSECMQRML